MKKSLENNLNNHLCFHNQAGTQGTCYHLKRRLKASFNDLREEVCVCCGKQKAYSTSESTQSADENEWSHKTAHSNFTFRSGFDLTGKNRFSTEPPITFPNSPLSTTLSSENIFGGSSEIPKKRQRNITEDRNRKQEANVKDKERFQYLNNGFCNGSAANTPIV